ncbi:MAG TPA: alpha/beta fold hydrolase [Xanthobacteraceae bacterium]|nr:alpha/beta fold hydrolase [Xanthobacteraceae bacterium]
MPHAHVNGIKIYYEVEGAGGAPWLTFSNSLRTDHTMWAPQIPDFAHHFRILRYDVRGHGQTEATPAPYTLDLLARDIVALWDHLGIKKSHWCGLSLGGMTGMHLGTDYPDYCDKLVICDCRGDSPPDIVEQWKKRSELVRAKGVGALADESINAWFGPEQKERDKDFIAAVRRTIEETSADGYVGCAMALTELKTAARVREIKAKTLFLVGSKDGPHPGLMKAMHEDLPGSQYVVIEDATHLSNLTHPKEFNAAVRRFLAS